MGIFPTARGFLRAPFLHGCHALAFLSLLSLIPCRTEEELRAATPWFPLAGLFLGLVWTAAGFCLFHYLGSYAALLPPFPALLAAWGWLCLAVWLTRGLHWDGMADLGDACGSGAREERFWQILRDSRMGAFGGMSLFMGLLGQWLCVAAHIQQEHWPALVIAPAWSRITSLWLAATTPPHGDGMLGRIVCASMTPSRLRWSLLWGALLALILLPCGIAWQRLPLLILGQWLLHRWFATTARRHGGISGDFFGAYIESAQLWFLLSLL